LTGLWEFFLFGQLKLGLAMALVVWPGLHLSSQSRFARQELESINRRHESLSRVDRSVSVLVKLIVLQDDAKNAETLAK
jgi:hypothetical protein